jgi:hypothetical protein
VISRGFDQYTLLPVGDKIVEGFGHRVTEITHVGKIVWPINEDNNVLPNISIKDYVLRSRMRFLSPQHWPQTMDDNHPNKVGTWSGTDRDEFVLH